MDFVELVYVDGFFSVTTGHRGVERVWGIMSPVLLVTTENLHMKPELKKRTRERHMSNLQNFPFAVNQ